MSWFSFKNKVPDNAPEFWKRYNQKFDDLESKAGRFGSTLDLQKLDDARFVAFDTETTGLDIKKDRILSIGGVAIKNNSIRVADSLELYLEQELYNPDAVHIHGILKQGNYTKVNEVAAVEQCLDYISTDILVGHHVGFDRDIINAALSRNGLGKLRNKMLDTGVLFKRLVHPINRPLQEKQYTLDELSESLKIPLHDRHTASGDAMITALAFIKIKDRLNKKGDLTLKKLYR